ncbi:MAG: DedA family protein, partial [Phycisphaerae bacterium]
MIIELVKTFLIHFTYLALVAVLVAAGLGVPIPEDVPLAFSGYLCHEDVSPVKAVLMIDSDGDGIPDTMPQGAEKRVPHVPIMILAGMIGVLTGDTIVFFIGRHGVSSNNFVARHIRKVLTPRRRERVEAHFRKHGGFTVFAGRFMPGLRSPIFAMAGLSQMSLSRFLCIDGLAAAISVPTFVLLGYYFAP